MCIIKGFYQFFQREDLAIVSRTPSKQRHIVDYRFRHKSLLDQIFIGSMPAPLAQFLMILICDQRTMYINRDFPAKCLIQTIVLRRGCKVFIPAHNMCDLHQMIVDHIGKVIGRESVRLDQDHIVQLIIRNCNISVNLVMECGRSLSRDIQADHPRFACR